METQRITKLNDFQERALLQTHQLLLEALRHREQDILRFLAILGPATAALVFLQLPDYRNDALVYILGMYAVLVALLISSMYSAALGYNFRCLTFQLAKFESSQCLGIEKLMLKRWPRKPIDFKKRYSTCCLPPENIKIFYIASTVTILALSCVRAFHLPVMPSKYLLWAWNAYPVFCFAGFLVALKEPFRFGRKICNAVQQEGEWGHGA